MSLPEVIAIGLVVMFGANTYHETQTLLQARASRRWPTAMADVEYGDAFVVQPGWYAHRTGGPIWRFLLANLRYTFAVGGVKYHASTYVHVGKGTRLLTHLFSGRIVVDGPPTVPIQYNPRNPAISVMESGARFSLYFEVALNLVGLAMVIAVALIVSTG